VIGPGSLPRWRPFVSPKRKTPTLAYTRYRRKKRRQKPAQPREVRHAEIVLFDRGHELPKAVLIDNTPLGGLRAWLFERWLWLSPRAVPVVVATVGMILVILSADYLAHSHYEPLPSWRP
jgi:hypothetical protein